MIFLFSHSDAFASLVVYMAALSMHCCGWMKTFAGGLRKHINSPLWMSYPEDEADGSHSRRGNDFGTVGHKVQQCGHDALSSVVKLSAQYWWQMSVRGRTRKGHGVKKQVYTPSDDPSTVMCYCSFSQYKGDGGSRCVKGTAPPTIMLYCLKVYFTFCILTKGFRVRLLLGEKY